MSVDICFSCDKCDGTGEKVEPAGADGEELRTVCPICEGTGKRKAIISAIALTAVLNSLVDEIADIKNKCGNIKDKLDNTKDKCDQIWDKVKTL